MARLKNSPKINLVVSAMFHGLVIGAVFLFAAHEGILGHKLQELTAVLVPKEKPPEPPKQEPHIEPPKEEPKVPEPPPQQVAKSEAPPSAPPPSSGSSAPAVAPAAVIPADFSFGDGAKQVITSANSAVDYYKNFVEYTLRDNWNRPEDLNDNNFVDEVEVQIDRDGNIKSYAINKKSGNKRWDESVIQAIASTRSIGRVPPTNFPVRFAVRFDVIPATETLSQ